MPISQTADSHLFFRQRILTSVMIIAAVFAALFGLMYDLGLNDIGRFHAWVDYGYSGLSMVLAGLFLRNHVQLETSLQLFLLFSLLTFVSALVNVPVDQFRGIWFFLLVFVAYVVGGIRTGLVYTVLSVLAISWATLALDLALNRESLVSMLLGLVIFSLLSLVYARQSFRYADLVEAKNLQLEYMASHDPLTGIFNSRSYETRGEALLALARRNGTSLSLLYLDIDHFKRINDDFGHHVGDGVLECFVQVVGREIRESDVFARIGGEEFCILLPNTELAGAGMLAEKVRQSVEDEECHVNGQRFSLTVSIGVSTWQEGDTSLLDIEKRADSALYEAKDTGRNRVAVGAG